MSFPQTSERLRDRYDIAVVGAGPAGVNAVRRLLTRSPGLRVLLVDKSNPFTRPKPCAEAVGRLGFEEATAVDRRWIHHEITKASFYAPCGAAVTYGDRMGGYIIDRTLMQRDIAAAGADLGADYVLETKVTTVGLFGNGQRELRLETGRTVTASVVIDASGASSPLGKGEGITWKAYDAEPAFFVIAEGVEHATDTVCIYMGQKIAPGGYAWMFPGRSELVNIGVLVGTEYRGSVNIRELLAGFLRERFPQARVKSYHAGTIACGYRRVPIAVDCLVKAGDAASTTNPMSRAGIVEALKSGLLAADCALGMLGASSQREMKRFASDYEKAWFNTLGKRHQKLLETKSSLQRVPDKDYDAAARALGEIPPARLTMARIFRTSLSRFPRLVWAMRHLM